jgi:hypothetical protein
MEVGLGRRGVGQCPTGPWLLHQELDAAGAHSASWRRHLVRAVVPPRLLLASPPLALRRPPLAAGPPVRFHSVCPCKPTSACVPPAFQKVYAAVRRTSPASAAASGAQLPSAMALPCTHRSASSRVGRASPVVASVHHSSTALVRWALGAAYRGHCRYTCMVVSGMPAHAAQCSRPSGPTLPYALARPPFVRACACQRAIAGDVASSV